MPDPADRIELIREHWRRHDNVAMEYIRKYGVFVCPITRPAHVNMVFEPPEELEQPLRFYLEVRSGIRVIECEGIMVKALS